MNPSLAPQRDLRALLAGCTTQTPVPALQVTGLALDSRRVRPGDLFIALPGHSVDGRRFIGAAVTAGARAVLVPAAGARPEAAVPVIAVADLPLWVSRIAAAFFGHPSRHMKIVGVTGTNGKSSVAHLVCQLASRTGRQAFLTGTLGNGPFERLEYTGMTTPDAIDVQAQLAAFLSQAADITAMEVSSHALAQHRVRDVAFDVAVFTNLTRDHLDYHGSMAAYGEAKRLLFLTESLQTAIVNVDDAFGASLRQRIPGAVRCLALSTVEPRADLRVTDVEAQAGGVAFVLETPWGRAPLRVPLYGRINAFNVAAALSALCALGYGFDDLVGRVQELVAVPGRLERFGGTAGQPLVFVDYAHTPDALEKVLESLRAHTHGALRVVFGAGGDRDSGKRPLMGAVAERLADVVIVTDDNPRTEDGDAIAADILSGCAHPERIRVLRDRGRAILSAIRESGPDDLVLVAGKGHETEQVVGLETRRFSDSETVRAVLASRGGPTTPGRFVDHQLSAR